MALRVFGRVFLPALLGALIVYFFTGTLPKIYSSYATLFFPLSPSGGGGALGAFGGGSSGGDAGAIPGLGGAIVYPLVGSGTTTAAGIVTSHSSLEAVVRRLNLDRLWHTDVLSATKILSGQVTAEPDRSGLLAIRVNSSSPGICVAIARELYRYLQRRSTELSAAANANNKRLVTARLREATHARDAAQARLEAVLRSTPLSSVSDVQKAFLSAQHALTDAKVNRDEERARLAALEGEYHRLAQSASVGSTVNALTTLNPAFAELAAELQRRRLALSDAMVAYANTSPRVFNAREQYRNAEAISNQVKKGAATAAGIASPEIIRARSEMAALDESVKANEAALKSSQRDVELSPREYAESTIAQANFDAARSKVNLLRDELDRAEVAESRDMSRFAIVDEPFEDPTPISPHRTLISLVAFLAIAGICLVPFVVGLVRAAEASAAP